MLRAVQNKPAMTFVPHLAEGDLAHNPKPFRVSRYLAGDLSTTSTKTPYNHLLQPLTKPFLDYLSQTFGIH